MSWQAYIDNSLLGSKQIQKAALFGLEGNMWAHSEGFELSAEEMKAIIDGYTSPDNLRSNGLHINGEKYFLLRADDRTLNGKLNQAGVFCVKTLRAVIVGVYLEGTQPGNASVVVEKLADYLIESGF